MFKKKVLSLLLAMFIGCQSCVVCTADVNLEGASETSTAEVIIGATSVRGSSESTAKTIVSVLFPIAAVLFAYLCIVDSARS